MTSVSVVVPTYNRWPQLEMALSALAAQDAPGVDLEIVVVSDGSTDGTNEQIEEGRAPLPVTFVAQPNRGVAAARNAGVGAARGDLIVFIDDDVVADPDCVAAHVAAHRQSDHPTVVIGPLLTPVDGILEPWVHWEQTMLYKQYDAMARGDWAPTARQFYTGNASLPREVFETSGGFDESFRRAEDVELAYRLHDAGVRFRFEFAARAFHHADRSYASWLANAGSYGRNDVAFWRDRGQEWLVPTIRAEYQGRHVLTRAFTRVGLAVPVLGVASRLAPHIATAADRMRFPGLGRRVLSAVYNLAYYDGLADELGGFSAFLAMSPLPARSLGDPELAEELDSP